MVDLLPQLITIRGIGSRGGRFSRTRCVSGYPIRRLETPGAGVPDDHFSGNAVLRPQGLFFCSIRFSGWVRTFYEQRRAQGQSHHAAVRALAFKWIRVVGFK
jgi:hypothetical protein